MSSYMNSGIVATGGAIWANLQIQDEGRDDLYQPRFNWNYQMRCKEMAGGGQGNWGELWPLPKMQSGDPSASLCMFGQDAAEAGRFEAPSSIFRGHWRPYFIRGICKDQAGNPLGGAVVTAVRASDNVAVGSIACDDRGVFEVPTLDTTPHFVHSYYASGNLAGRSVSTLTPTL